LCRVSGGAIMPASKVDTIVRGGQVVTASEAYEASIAIQGERIVGIGPDELLPAADAYIDASGEYVLPGAIDCHVHLGGHDDYLTGGVAAARQCLSFNFVSCTGHAVSGALPKNSDVPKKREGCLKVGMGGFGICFTLKGLSWT
jgi:hypothetical protein